MLIIIETLRRLSLVNNFVFCTHTHTLSPTQLQLFWHWNMLTSFSIYEVFFSPLTVALPLFSQKTTFFILINAAATSQRWLHRTFKAVKPPKHCGVSLLTHAVFVFRQWDRKWWRQCVSCKAEIFSESSSTWKQTIVTSQQGVISAWDSWHASIGFDFQLNSGTKFTVNQCAWFARDKILLSLKFRWISSCTLSCCYKNKYPTTFISDVCSFENIYGLNIITVEAHSLQFNPFATVSFHIQNNFKKPRATSVLGSKDFWRWG